MSLFSVFCFSLATFIYVYLIVDRICKCVENCKVTKSFNDFLDDPDVKDRVVNHMFEGAKNDERV